MKLTPRSIRLSLVVSVALAGIWAGSGARAQEVVVNGGFETGDFTGWTVSDPNTFQNTNVGNDPLFAHPPGTYHANLGASPNVGTLTQTLTTAPGQTYTLSFWLANDGGADVPNGILNSFDVFWNGNATPVFSESNVSISNYTHYTLSLLAPTTSTTLEFDYRNDDDFFRLDDVSATAPVPEPSATWLVLAGLPLLAIVTRRRAKSTR